MASTVKFKFKAAKAYDTVSFPGTSIKLLDLKRAIVEQKRLHQGMEFDLTVVNEKTKEEYKEDSSIVTKNACVVVKRVPAPKTGGLLAKIKAIEAAAALQSTATGAAVGQQGGGALKSGGAGAGTGASGNGNAPARTQEDEEAALNALNQQAGSMRHGFANRTWTADGGSGPGVNRTMTFGAGRGPGAPGGGAGRRGQNNGPPPGMDGGPGRGMDRGGAGRGFYSGRGMGKPPKDYLCRRCNQPGHFIQECPTNGDAAFDKNRTKRVVGIPTSMIQLAEGIGPTIPGQGGGLVNASGQLVTIRANDQAFRKLKEFGGGQSVQGLLDRLSKNAPEHLKCPICHKIMTDAVIVPCCHKSTCDSCVRRALASSPDMSCPLCKTRNVGPDSLLPNMSLRAAVDEYLTRVTRESRGRANQERVDSERAQEDADRIKREEDAAAGPAAAGAGGNKRKRAGQKGVDAILELAPRDKGDDDGEDEDESADPFGHDVYDVQSQPDETLKNDPADGDSNKPNDRSDGETRQNNNDVQGNNQMRGQMQGPPGGPGFYDGGQRGGGGMGMRPGPARPGYGGENQGIMGGGPPGFQNQRMLMQHQPQQRQHAHSDLAGAFPPGNNHIRLSPQRQQGGDVPGNRGFARDGIGGPGGARGGMGMDMGMNVGGGGGAGGLPMGIGGPNVGGSGGPPMGGPNNNMRRPANPNNNVGPHLNRGGPVGGGMGGPLSNTANLNSGGGGVNTRPPMMGGGNNMGPGGPGPGRLPNSINMGGPGPKMAGGLRMGNDTGGPNRGPGAGPRGPGQGGMGPGGPIMRRGGGDQGDENNRNFKRQKNGNGNDSMGLLPGGPPGMGRPPGQSGPGWNGPMGTGPMGPDGPLPPNARINNNHMAGGQSSGRDGGGGGGGTGGSRGMGPGSGGPGSRSPVGPMGMAGGDVGQMMGGPNRVGGGGSGPGGPRPGGGGGSVGPAGVGSGMAGGRGNIGQMGAGDMQRSGAGDMRDTNVRGGAQGGGNNMHRGGEMRGGNLNVNINAPQREGGDMRSDNTNAMQGGNNNHNMRRDDLGRGGDNRGDMRPGDRRGDSVPGALMIPGSGVGPSPMGHSGPNMGPIGPRGINPINAGPRSNSAGSGRGGMDGGPPGMNTGHASRQQPQGGVTGAGRGPDAGGAAGGGRTFFDGPRGGGGGPGQGGMGVGGHGNRIVGGPRGQQRPGGVGGGGGARPGPGGPPGTGMPGGARPRGEGMAPGNRQDPGGLGGGGGDGREVPGGNNNNPQPFADRPVGGNNRIGGGPLGAPTGGGGGGMSGGVVGRGGGVGERETGRGGVPLLPDPVGRGALMGPGPPGMGGTVPGRVAQGMGADPGLARPGPNGTRGGPNDRNFPHDRPGMRGVRAGPVPEHADGPMMENRAGGPRLGPIRDRGDGVHAGGPGSRLGPGPDGRGPQMDRPVDRRPPAVMMNSNHHGPQQQHIMGNSVRGLNTMEHSGPGGRGGLPIDRRQQNHPLDQGLGLGVPPVGGNQPGGGRLVDASGAGISRGVGDHGGGGGMMTHGAGGGRVRMGVHDNGPMPRPLLGIGGGTFSGLVVGGQRPNQHQQEDYSGNVPNARMNLRSNSQHGDVFNKNYTSKAAKKQAKAKSWKQKRKDAAADAAAAKPAAASGDPVAQTSEETPQGAKGKEELVEEPPPETTSNPPEVEERQSGQGAASEGPSETDGASAEPETETASTSIQDQKKGGQVETAADVDSNDISKSVAESEAKLPLSAGDETMRGDDISREVQSTDNSSRPPGVDDKDSDKSVGVGNDATTKNSELSKSRPSSAERDNRDREDEGKSGAGSQNIPPHQQQRRPFNSRDRPPMAGPMTGGDNDNSWVLQGQPEPGDGVLHPVGQWSGEGQSQHSNQHLQYSDSYRRPMDAGGYTSGDQFNVAHQAVGRGGAGFHGPGFVGPGFPGPDFSGPGFPGGLPQPPQFQPQTHPNFSGNVPLDPTLEKYGPNIGPPQNSPQQNQSQQRWESRDRGGGGGRARGSRGGRDTNRQWVSPGRGRGGPSSGYQGGDRGNWRGGPRGGDRDYAQERRSRDRGSGYDKGHTGGGEGERSGDRRREGERYDDSRDRGSRRKNSRDNWEGGDERGGGRGRSRDDSRGGSGKERDRSNAGRGGSPGDERRGRSNSRGGQDSRGHGGHRGERGSSRSRDEHRATDRSPDKHKSSSSNNNNNKRRASSRSRDNNRTSLKPDGDLDNHTVEVQQPNRSAESGGGAGSGNSRDERRSEDAPGSRGGVQKAPSPDSGRGKDREREDKSAKKKKDKKEKKAKKEKKDKRDRKEKPKDNHHGDDGTGYKNSDHHSSHNDHHDDNNDHGNFHGPSRPTATSVQIGPRRSFSPHHEHHAGGRYPLEPQPSFGSGASIAEDGGDVAQFGERRERKGSKRAKVVEQKEKTSGTKRRRHEGHSNSKESKMRGVGSKSSTVGLASLKQTTSGNGGRDDSPERWNPTPGPEELAAEVLESKQRKKARKEGKPYSGGAGGGAIVSSDFYTKRNRPRS